MAVAYRSHVAAYHYEAAGTVTLTKPTGTAEGDVLLAGFVNNDGTRTLNTLPSGWTALDVSGTTTTPSTRQWVAWKKAGASEPASYAFVFSSSFNGATAIAAYSGADTVNVTAVATVSAIQSTPYSAVAPTMTTTVADCLKVAIIGTLHTTTGSAASFTPPSGYTERFELGVSYENRSLSFADLIQASAGASGTATASVAVTGGGDGRAHAAHVAISPAVTSNTSRPSSDVSDGTWTASDAGPDLYAMIDETVASDADYIEASAAGTSEVALSTVAAPTSGWLTKIRYRVNGEVTVSLRQGASTQIASWAQSPGTATTYEQTLSSGEQAAISNWADLRLRFVKA